MTIASISELSLYLQQDVDAPTAQLLLELTDGVIAERIGVVAVPAAAGVKAVALEVAARAYRNPARLTSETIDDYTWRVDNAGDAGVFLLEDEIRRMRPGSARVRSQILSAYGDITV